MMLIASLLLAGLGIVISTIALTLAVIQDIKDRNRRIRGTRSATSIPMPVERPTLRLWEPAREPDRPLTPTQPRGFITGPDIIVGSPSAHPSTADETAPRRAA